MAILDILTEISDKLRTELPDLKVELFPDKPSEYKLIHPKGAILVSFNSSVYTEPESFEFIQQVETLKIGLVLLIRGVRDKDGSYAYLDRIETALTGYKPTGCTKMYPAERSFISESGGIWQHGFTFETTQENYD